MQANKPSLEKILADVTPKRITARIKVLWEEIGVLREGAFLTYSEICGILGEHYEVNVTPKQLAGAMRRIRKNPPGVNRKKVKAIVPEITGALRKEMATQKLLDEARLADEAPRQTPLDKRRKI